jgi:glycosyltransferase involved in cell wall biosynthesis
MVKTAVVHEWFTALAGSEKVIEQFCKLYPEADLFAVYADATTVAKAEYLQGRAIQTSFIQNMPKAAKHYRNYLPLMPLAIEQFDLSAYDVVLSSAHAVAKGVLTGPDQLHISYVHSPMRYAWDLQHQYLREAGLTSGVKGWMTKGLLHWMRMWDHRTAAGVDHFVANSHYIARRIRKVYRREAEVIYPPVDVSEFSMGEQRDDFYLAVSRMVPYKKMDLIIEAFAQTPQRKLVVVGEGPEFEKCKAKAGRNITLLGYQSLDTLRDLMQRTRALVFAAEEDFGIIVVEAQACGAPVIAFGKGGALETVVGLDTGAARPTGVFFQRQDVPSLLSAVDQFERSEELFEPEACRANALRFSQERFCDDFGRFVQQCKHDDQHSQRTRTERLRTVTQLRQPSRERSEITSTFPVRTDTSSHSNQSSRDSREVAPVQDAALR